MLDVKSLMFNISELCVVQIKPDSCKLTICLAVSQLINKIYETAVTMGRRSGQDCCAVHIRPVSLVSDEACCVRGMAWYDSVGVHCVNKTCEVFFLDCRFFVFVMFVVCVVSELKHSQGLHTTHKSSLFVTAVTFLMEQLWSQVTQEL